MITLKNVTLRRGINVLLQNINWTIYQKQHIGIVGANGSGKTSLFKMLLGELHADVGDVEIPRQLRLSHVAQETPAYEKSALEYTLDGDTELRAIQQQIIAAEEKDDGHLLAKLHAELDVIDAYTAEARAGQLLNGLGFNQEEQQQSVSSFSGGWRVRLNLAKALMCRSDVLLLDEPTNHLDLDAVLWLENWLGRYPGTLLLISHDRDFLDQVVGHIVHFSDQQLKVYTGNYSSFERQRAAHILLQQAAYEKQQKQIAHLQSFVDRFRAKASKARQAQSRIKAIERMDLIDVVHIDTAFEFHFKQADKCPNPLIQIFDATIAYDKKIVLRDLNLSISPKDRIALLGPNGAGKSSLIKLLADEIIPTEGTREVSEGLKIGYFAQHQIDHLQLDDTPMNHLKKIAPHVREQELRGFLGGFGFVGQRVFESIKNFSGGEKSRLALALIVWQRPNLLLLDEPTNHLDLDMRHALSMALQEYEGALILVSHDRFLVRSTVDQLLLVAEHQLREFDGDIDDYERWLLDFRKQELSPKTEKSTLSRKEQRQENAKQRELRKPLMQKITKLETELANLQKENSAIEIILTDSTLYEEANKEKLQQHLKQQTAIISRLQSTEKKWLQACEELNKFDK